MRKIKKASAVIAAVLAAQIAAAPFAGALSMGESIKLETNPQTTAETQKLIDSKPQTLRAMENLSRGAVAFKTEKSVMLSWRWLGTETADTKYNVYRNGEKLTETPISKTMFYDVAPVDGATYQVAAVTDGKEGEKSAPVSVWENNSLTVPIQAPEGGAVEGENYTYSAGDASVGDLDGDGEYEIVLKWDPSNSKDSAKEGFTGPCVIDAYKMDGTRMWRINMGANIRAGAHDTQFLVYDFDGDGKAEVAMRTADGTTAADGAVIGDASKNWAVLNNGKNLQGPLFLTVFEGATGKILDTTDYDPQTGNLADWGDTWGNRSERYLATVAYVNGTKPDMVFARGYYSGDEGKGRTVIAAFRFEDGKIVKDWTFDTADEGNGGYISQGNHSMLAADVDFDGSDEIIYGALVVDHNGKALYSTGLGHGDAQHTGDLIPNRPGLETFSVHEHTDAKYSVEMRDARTGEFIFGLPCLNSDIGRGVSGDIDPDHYGAESWAAGNMFDSDGNVIAEKQSVPENFLVYWDGDLGSELQDNINISKWNAKKNKTDVIFTAAGCTSINSTKSNPSLTADLFGDWREEVMYPTKDNAALKIFTTDIPTAYKIPTLMHNSLYRQYIVTQNVAYNQPAHLSYYLGFDTETVPVPEITVGENTNPDLNKKTWHISELTETAGVALVIGQPKASVNGKIVRIDNASDETAPYIAEGDRTLVPIRFLSEAFGASVNWDGDAQQITIDLKNQKIVMTANEKNYTLNGEVRELDVPATIKNDRTYVPFRAIAEMFDKYVQYWNDTSLITAIDFKTGDIPANVAAAAYNDIIKAQLPDPVEEKPIIALDKLYENQADVYAVEASGNDGNVEMNAVDGDMSTRWSAYGPNTLTLDLKNEIEISGVAVAMWKGDERIYPFTIEVSSDGETWTTAHEKTQNSGTTDEAELYSFKEPVKARYVRYNGDGSTAEGKNYCHISEIVVLKK